MNDIITLILALGALAIIQVELLSHGLPVIATSHCGNIVTDGVDGLKIEACSPEALRRALEALHQDRGLLAKMSKNAVASSKRFSYQCFLEAFENAIRDIQLRVAAAGGGRQS